MAEWVKTVTPPGYRILQDDFEAYIPVRQNADGKWEMIYKYWYPFRYRSLEGALKRCRLDAEERRLARTDNYEI